MGGTSSLTNINVNGVVNPSSYGIPSNGDATMTTGSIVSGTATLTIASATSFVTKQGIFISHAGVTCGSLRGTVCPSGPIPAIRTVGTAGRTTYSYRVSCLDGLGGVGIASKAVEITTGNASLSSTNSNLLTFNATAGCIEIAIYRNDALIATQYASSSRTFAYQDIGLPVTKTNRDIPLVPVSATLNDNLVALITAKAGSTLTLSATASASVSGASVYHSDTPLLQAAVNARRSVTGDANYRLNYPLQMVNAGGIYEFSAICDTGDVCVDATGQYNLTLNNVSLNEYATMTDPSSIGLYCSRNANRTTSQYLNTTNLFISVGGGLSGTGKGSVAFYNYGCEIENHISANFNSDQLAVLTATNIWNVPSLFDSTQASGAQSMSQINFLQPSGGTLGAFWTLENTYTVNINGGYHFGGNSTTYPWAFEIYGGTGDLHVVGYRTEGKSAFLHLNTGASIRYGLVDVGVYRNNLPIKPQIYMEDGSNVSMLQFKADDFGGSASVQPIYGCKTTNCSINWSQIFVGVNQSFDSTYGANNVVSQVNKGVINTGAFTWTSGLRISGADLNSVTACGYYDGNNLGNAPEIYRSGYVRIQNVCSADPGYLTQIAYDMTTTRTIAQFSRVRAAGVWGPWQQTAGGFNGTKTVGACVLSISQGLITNVTGC